MFAYARILRFEKQSRRREPGAVVAAQVIAVEKRFGMPVARKRSSAVATSSLLVSCLIGLTAPGSLVADSEKTQAPAQTNSSDQIHEMGVTIDSKEKKWGFKILLTCRNEKGTLAEPTVVAHRVGVDRCPLADVAELLRTGTKPAFRIRRNEQYFVIIKRWPTRKSVLNGKNTVMVTVDFNIVAFDREHAPFEITGKVYNKKFIEFDRKNQIYEFDGGVTLKFDSGNRFSVDAIFPGGQPYETGWKQHAPGDRFKGRLLAPPDSLDSDLGEIVNVEWQIRAPEKRSRPTSRPAQSEQDLKKQR
jgi:hypothetical protein